METIQHIPKTSLARKTREVLQAVQRGQTVVVEHHGQPEVAIVDIIDYYLLRAAMHYHAHSPSVEDESGLSDDAVAALELAQEQTNLVLAHYLAGGISLSRAAKLLQLPWLDLRTRFLRLDIPLRTAHRDADEIATDLRNAADYASSS